jgi:peroxiredoxin
MGAEVWAISPDPGEKLAAYAAKNEIGFTLLSDPDLEVIGGWGLVNPSKPQVPHPTAVIVDAEGTIRYVRQDQDYSKRPTTQELIEALAGLSAD